MPVDLRTSGAFQRASVVVRGDNLTILEHRFASDRVKRIAFDRIESVVAWQSLPWLYLLTLVPLFAVPGALAIIFGGEVGAWVVGTILLLLSVIPLVWLLIKRKTTIRIHRAGTHTDIKGLMSAGKMRKFLGKLEYAIRLAQERAEVDALERQAAAPAEVFDDVVILEELPPEPPPTEFPSPEPPASAGG